MHDELEHNHNQREGALVSRTSQSGFEITLYPMAFGNTRLCVGEPGANIFDRAWCFSAAQHDDAVQCALSWDGMSDTPPAAWIRDLQTGDRRELDAQGNIVRAWVQA